MKVDEKRRYIRTVEAGTLMVRARVVLCEDMPNAQLVIVEIV